MDNAKFKVPDLDGSKELDEVSGNNPASFHDLDGGLCLC